MKIEKYVKFYTVYTYNNIWFTVYQCLDGIWRRTVILPATVGNQWATILFVRSINPQRFTLPASRAVPRQSLTLVLKWILLLQTKKTIKRFTMIFDRHNNSMVVKHYLSYYRRIPIAPVSADWVRLSKENVQWTAVTPSSYSSFWPA